MTIFKTIENYSNVKPWIKISSDIVNWLIIDVRHSSKKLVCVTIVKEKMNYNGDNMSLLDQKEASESAQMFIEATRLSKLSEEKFEEECKKLNSSVEISHCQQADTSKSVMRQAYYEDYLRRKRSKPS